MSVGEATIDSQHRKLIEQINEMLRILSSLNVEMSALRQSGHFLYTYITGHLSYEEKYMEDNGYPQLEKHRMLHQKFIAFYKEIQEEIKKESTSPNFSSIEVEKIVKKIHDYLIAWVRHIKIDDQKYARYIRSR